MTVEKTIDNESSNVNLSKLFKEEIFSEQWSRATLKNITVHRCYLFVEKHKICDKRFATAHSLEIVSTKDKPKDILDEYKSENENQDSIYKPRFKNWSHDEDVDKLDEICYNGTNWIYKPIKKICVEIESIEGSYSEKYYLNAKSSDNINGLYKKLYNKLGSSCLVREDRKKEIRIDKKKTPHSKFEMINNGIKNILLGSIFIVSQFMVLSIPLAILFTIMSFIGISKLIVIFTIITLTFISLKHQVLAYLYIWEYTLKLNDYIKPNKYSLSKTNDSVLDSTEILNNFVNNSYKFKYFNVNLNRQHIIIKDDTKKWTISRQENIGQIIKSIENKYNNDKIYAKYRKNNKDINVNDGVFLSDCGNYILNTNH